jgi:UDP-N-acetylmuramyl pentapeptide phosphotransferase/UDP-N-acetylglucosamine-1-phosphate transferase
LADDIKDLKPNIKLLGQTMAALIVTLVGGIKISDLGSFWLSGAVLPDWAAIPLTVLVIVGVTNATNLSDGLDGLAGGIALLIFLCIGYLGVMQSQRLGNGNDCHCGRRERAWLFKVQQLSRTAFYGRRGKSTAWFRGDCACH